jgi:hypothetical protein
MAQFTPQQALPAVRLAIGTGAYVLPELTGTIFGFDNLKENHEAVLMGRLFGIRDVALGLGVLSSKGESRALWWRLGIMCDVADAAAGIIGIKAGAPRRGHVLATITALGAVAIGLSGLSSAADYPAGSAAAG